MTRHTLQEEVEKQRRIVSGEIAASLFHDFQSQVVNARNAAKMIKAELERSERINRKKLAVLCDDIIRAETHNLSVIKGFMQLSFRPRTACVSLSSVVSSVKEAIFLLSKRAHKIELRVIEGPSPSISADPAFLSHALLNIILNAQENSYEDHRVCVEVIPSRNGIEVLTINTAVREMVHHIDSWSELGFSTKGSGGAGYGLTIAKKAIEHMGGELKLRVTSTKEPNLVSVSCSIKLEAQP